MRRVRKYTKKQAAHKRAYMRAYWRRNKKAKTDYMRAYWTTEKHRIYRRTYRAENRNHIVSVIGAWKKQNREATRASNRRSERNAWANLIDSQLRKYLKRTTKTNPTQQEIEICRQQIQVKRAMKVAQLFNAAQQLSKDLQDLPQPS